MNLFEKSRIFIYQNARPLDLARWNYHFENGNKEEVIKALQFYQNEDGGFGHALEADSWNPFSSPIQTWVAIEILNEIDFNDKEHPIIKGILNYLASGKDFDGRLWNTSVKSNNDYPHAQWWEFIDNRINCDYNPTACLAGFIIKYSDINSDLYKLGKRIVREAYEALINDNNKFDMHTIACYIRMFEFCHKSKESIINTTLLENKLKTIISNLITKNLNEWENGYICKPSHFFNKRNSPFYEENKELANYELSFIQKSQKEDGSWNVNWFWKSYQEEWSISKNWWKCDIIIKNLLYMKNMTDSFINLF